MNTSTPNTITAEPQVIALTTDQCQTRMTELDDQWQLNTEQSQLQRTFSFKGYAKAVSLSQMAAWLASESGHHPDIAFGWGYCRINLTTHDANGLSERDFVFAQSLDSLLEVSKNRTP